MDTTCHYLNMELSQNKMTQLINPSNDCKETILPWELDSHKAARNWHCAFPTATTASNLTPSWALLTQSTSTHPMSLNVILILSFNYAFVLVPRTLLIQVLLSEFCPVVFLWCALYATVTIVWILYAYPNILFIQVRQSHTRSHYSRWQYRMTFNNNALGHRPCITWKVSIQAHSILFTVVTA